MLFFGVFERTLKLARLEMTEIMLKGRKTLTHPSINLKFGSGAVLARVLGAYSW